MSRVQELVQATPPMTLVVVACCSVLHLLQMIVGPPLHSVTLSPRLVIGLGDYYRIITSALYHGGLMHIGMNMISMVAMGGMLEKRTGTLSLAVTILYSILLTSVLYIAVAWFTYIVMDQEKLLYQHSLGFSGVLFHLSVLECHLGPLQPRSLFGITTVSPKYYPWVLLVVLQFIMPNLSFMGHLSGVLVGTLQVYGYLDVLLPLDATLRELDSLATPCNTRWFPNFVPTQQTTRGDAPSGGLGRALGSIWTLIKQFFEAVFVIIFGRGHRLNANISIWPTSPRNLQQASSPEETTSTPATIERSRLVRDSEMV